MEYSFQMVYLCHVNKQESILKSAVKLLAEKGIHNTPMSAIAKAAGTGMGTIYNYFPNKEELINALYLYIKNQEKDIFKAFDPNLPVKTQFENYFTAFIDFFISHAAYFKIIEQLQASPIITEESRMEGSKSVTPFYELINYGQKNRIIKNIDPSELMTFAGGAVLSYLRWYFNQPEKTEKKLSNQLKLVWDAIKE